MAAIIQDLIKSSLAELADEDFQRQLWLGKIEGLAGSPTEAVCSLFDDSGLGAALDAEGAFNEDIDNQLLEIDNQISDIDFEGRPMEEVLTDPKMATVRQQAAKALFMIVRSEASSYET